MREDIRLGHPILRILAVDLDGGVLVGLVKCIALFWSISVWLSLSKRCIKLPNLLVVLILPVISARLLISSGYKTILSCILSDDLEP